MKPMPSSTSWFSRALAVALLVVPAAAHAQSLPKGYASDESPASTPAKTATTPTPAATTEMKSTVVDTSTDAGTAQISTATDEYTDTDPSALTDFQEPLQGYGAWVNDDSYGTVWVPDTSVVGADFAPYQSGGYWTLTDDDQWLWVSTYDWGYVPFHYGRWVWISGRGWAWIPGRTYAPAWVVWRTSDYGYLGWAPMPPTWYWYGGSAVYFTTVPSAAYVFCPTTYVFHTHVTNYVVRDKDTISRIASHSRNYTPANPTTTTTSHDSKSPGSASASAGTHSASQASASAGAKGGVSAVKKPVGPSMKEAGVPESAVPSKRTAVDARASLYSKKSTTAKAKALVKQQRTALASTAGSAPGSRAGLVQPGTRAPSPSSAVVSSRTSQPIGVSAPRTSQPVTMPHTSQPVSVAAPRTSQPITMPRTSQPVSAPRVSAPVSVPRVSAPVSRPSFSAPRVSAPVSRPSVSAPRVSTPHFGGGGGGVRFGGGHRR